MTAAVSESTGLDEENVDERYRKALWTRSMRPIAKLRGSEAVVRTLGEERRSDIVDTRYSKVFAYDLNGSKVSF